MISLLDPHLLVAAFAIAVLAGVIKGIVGFAMPMVLISGLSTFLEPELALAGLIFPTVVTNGWQALRQGVHAAVESIRAYRYFLLAGFVTLVISAQAVRILAPEALLLIIGIPVAGFAVLQLLGWQLKLGRRTTRLDVAVGGFAGLIGGLSGVWGPPTVLYLTALGTEKTEQIRVQGMIYGLGAVALVGAHFGSGVLRADTAPLSLFLVLPALVGMWIGNRVQDRIDQATFRKATLIVLTIAALNLIRRALLS